MQENEGVQVKKKLVELPEFNTVPLPENSVELSSITDFDKHSVAVLEYIASRNLNLDDTKYYWSSNLGYRDRLIIPFYFEKRISWRNGFCGSPRKSRLCSCRRYCDACKKIFGVWEFCSDQSW